jgi:hypothetical protein
MPNTYITPSLIAQEALIALENNLVMADLVHRDYSQDFQPGAGATITIRKPTSFTAAEFTSAISAQAITETSTTVVLDKHLDVSIELAPTDLSLSIQDFTTQITLPAMRAIAQKIDALLCGLYKAVPYRFGTAATTPNALSYVAGVGKVLNTNKVPMQDRRLVIDPEAEAALLVLDGIVNVDKSGASQALRDAIIGRVYGFNPLAMDQNIVAHTKGTLDAGALATGTALASTIAIASGGNGGTLKEGDIFTIVGNTTQFVCTALATCNGSGAASGVGIYPALPAGFSPSGAAITLVGSHTANLAFHKNAFALVSRPLALPQGMEATGYVATNEQTGLAVRVMNGYTMASKVQTISFDVLCGVKCIYPELAARLLG